MRGGVDGVYTRVFGEGVESRLQAIIRTLPAEELPVGEALIVPTGHSGIPWLISAPTMRRPSVLHDGRSREAFGAGRRVRGLNKHLRP